MSTKPKPFVMLMGDGTVHQVGRYATQESAIKAVHRYLSDIGPQVTTLRLEVQFRPKYQYDLQSPDVNPDGLKCYQTVYAVLTYTPRPE